MSQKKTPAKTKHAAKEASPKMESVEFHYIKSNFFRTVRGDGVFGGVSPRGDIQIALFSERMPIPQIQVWDVADGQLKAEVADKRVSRPGIVREVEINVIMTVDMAKDLAKFLLQTVKTHDELTSTRAERGK